ncbi:class I SAM-dependent methyltransferase [Sphingomonas sp. BIUV-7]|uniref:Class I SAM-dependent methyltransferase n=1 Tax=Sphingomonas natans TaxID=3063330 RepID=A0ABT8Y383_9SPHN|nr:class I SAM-dependent methyltransferase [Sphingomonas sp. BIUV-7]MDO6412765.1 class I SAM-dependent methyltransferase [Sphingomonas sp. BIUV-7]
MSGYHDARLSEDPRRGATWSALWHYVFRHHVRPEDCVLDLGAGYGDFINAVVARERIAVDAWPGMADHLAPGVTPVVTPATDLSAIPPGSVDFALASNLFEHLSRDDARTTLAELRRVLRSGGTLALLQPNYRYAYREYFDDYTHLVAYSHIALADLLRAEGWRVTMIKPRFLPLTIKSRLPTWRWLIGAYLRSPIKPMGKQMLVMAQPG